MLYQDIRQEQESVTFLESINNQLSRTVDLHKVQYSQRPSARRSRRSNNPSETPYFQSAAKGTSSVFSKVMNKLMVAPVSKTSKTNLPLDKHNLSVLTVRQVGNKFDPLLTSRTEAEAPLSSSRATQGTRGRVQLKQKLIKDIFNKEEYARHKRGLTMGSSAMDHRIYKPLITTLSAVQSKEISIEQ